MSNKLNGWKKSAIATAAVLGLLSGQAYALSLGRITVQSALGEPLRAKIEVLDISAEEAASLKTAIASPDAFSAAGLQYNPAMPDLQVRLQRQADGRAVIELSSQRLINDPFIDLLIEATWASGRIVRDYTLLFDPPSLQASSPTAPTPAQVPAESAQAAGSTPVAMPTPALAAPQAAASAPVAAAASSAQAAAQAKVKVKSGDTASAIALRSKPANISLDQMLVALLRANPNAFINNNVNRLKAGALVTMPSAATAEFEPATQASQIVVAQSLDFNDYRRKLAAASPQSAVLNADRKASGTLQTKVEDKKQTSPSPDKLTLSKGNVKGVTPEAQIATELAAKDSAERAAEIAKNISDLSKLNVTTNVEAPPPVPAPSAPASATLAPTLAVAPLPKVSAATAAAAPKIAASAPQKSSPGWLEGLINNPYTPLGAVGLMAALAGFGVYRHKKRTKVQSSLFADQLSPQTPGESPEASSFSAAPTEPEHPLTPAPGLDLPDDELTARAYVKDLAMDLDLNLDLDLEPDEPSQPIKPAPTKHPEPATLAQSIDLALPDLDIFTAPEVGKAVTRVADLKPRPPPPSKAPIAPSAPDLSTLDFDIGALSLDLDDASDDDKPTASGDSQDPLETKLALAHEFSAIGDEYGARALIEEVIAEATGTMKTKAERALSQLQGS